MKKIIIAGVLLAAVCAGAGAAAYAALAEDDSVSVQTEPARTRADYIEMWKADLAKSGKELPADVDSMTTQEILDAWGRELGKHAQPG
ncbi:hypothetical protein [Streptomyces cupreus]|uniref:Uncharacterized protein n=1 Tax=Streptomyces cupreus TaxID=2759956 RepID=A0A7X1MA21_9ACTN|nr:hypothetical protein [Streptomyces cupreus]MBC2903849.1 hypothetical protein [Streptomyces cupreus]